MLPAIIELLYNLLLNTTLLENFNYYFELLNNENLLSYLRLANNIKRLIKGGIKMTDGINQELNIAIDNRSQCIETVLGIEPDKSGISLDIEHFKDFNDKDELNEELLSLTVKFLHGNEARG
jgi:hypothetical protein